MALNEVLYVEKIKGYAALMRLDRPIGILLLLWPTLWALLAASELNPDPWVALVLLAGVVVMRSAGCVINDFADRNFDGGVERTQFRPLVTGVVTPKEALTLFVALLCVALALVLTLNALTIQLAFAAAALATLYPFMKRVTYLPQLVLGIAFSWAIPMAYAAQTGAVPAACWWIFAANVLWTVAYDTQYAMVDREDDLKVGIKSTAILFGRADLMIISLLQGLTLVCLTGFGWQQELGWGFYTGLVLAAVLFVQQGWLCRGRAKKACFQAFLNNNRVGLVIALGFTLALLPIAQ